MKYIIYVQIFIFEIKKFNLLMKSYQYSDRGIHIVLCVGVWDWSGVDREFIFRELYKFNRGGG